VAKKSGPGAKAPAAVTRITVEAKCRTSMRLDSSSAT
jgi:hypothetical protein